MNESLDLARRADITIGNALVQPSLRLITGPESEATVEPRVMQVLLALHDAEGRVLSREDLLEICWPGVIVGDDAINRTIAEIRRVARDTGAVIVIETIPRVGYRLASQEDAAGKVGTGAKVRGPALPRRKLVIGGLAAAAAIAGGGYGLLHYRRGTAIDELIERGRLAQASGRPDSRTQAQEIFRQAIAMDPERADAWGWLARVLGDDAAAREAALHAIEIDPREANARVVLISQRKDLHSWTEWEDELLEVLKDAPDNTAAQRSLSFFYQGMGRCKDSWRVQEQTLKLEPFNPASHNTSALKHWIFGKNGEADKIADQALRLWPRHPLLWNARMVIYAFTNRAPAGLALLDDVPNRPANLTSASIDSWRAALGAIATRSSADIARALEVCTAQAKLAPGLAANAIMAFAYLGEVDASYQVAEGLFEGRGAIVQKSHGKGIGDLYSTAGWGRTQVIFTPAAVAFREDGRFSDFCERLGLTAYWRERGIWPDPFVRGSLRTS